MENQTLTRGGGRGATEHPLRYTRLWYPVLRIRIRDPVPFRPLDPGSGMGRKSASGSGMNNPDHIFSYKPFFFVKILKFLMRIRDPGWRQFESRMEKSRIRDNNTDGISTEHTRMFIINRYRIGNSSTGRYALLVQSTYLVPTVPRPSKERHQSETHRGPLAHPTCYIQILNRYQ
jgi:hypothetical protein